MISGKQFQKYTQCQAYVFDYSSFFPFQTIELIGLAFQAPADKLNIP